MSSASGFGVPPADSGPQAETSEATVDDDGKSKVVRKEYPTLHYMVCAGWVKTGTQFRWVEAGSSSGTVTARLADNRGYPAKKFPLVFEVDMARYHEGLSVTDMETKLEEVFKTLKKLRDDCTTGQAFPPFFTASSSCWWWSSPLRCPALRSSSSGKPRTSRWIVPWRV